VHQDFHWLIIATKLLTAKLHSLYVKESESGVRVGHFWNVVVGVGVGYSTSNSGTLVDSEVFWILCCRTGLTGWWDKQFVQRKEKFVYLKIVEQLRRFPSLSLKLRLDIAQNFFNVTFIGGNHAWTLLDLWSITIAIENPAI